MSTINYIFNPLLKHCLQEETNNGGGGDTNIYFVDATTTGGTFANLATELGLAVNAIVVIYNIAAGVAYTFTDSTNTARTIQGQPGNNIMLRYAGDGNFDTINITPIY